MSSKHNVLTIAGLREFCKGIRCFDAQYVLHEKLNEINAFFKSEGLDSVVLGLSGGIDSSVVFKLLVKASERPGSPIKRILGVFMPIYSKGITGQNIAESFVKDLIYQCYWSPKAREVMRYVRTDLTKAASAYELAMTPGTAWGVGQICSIVRTPALYGHAAILQEQGYRSIVAGTTNRDEGAYIGFFGKASDGMVDLQPIADLHKSEVRQIAELLEVPDTIINRDPVGDVWDKKTDEEMFGAPYWFLELYQILLEENATYLVSYPQDCPDAKKWAMNIEVAHEKNKHKYKVGSPARYIDVMKRTLEHSSC